MDNEKDEGEMQNNVELRQYILLLLCKLMRSRKEYDDNQSLK